jgi:hypothetical protein
MRHARKLTSISVAMNTTAPTLAAIHREKGKEFAIGLTMAWLVYLNDILNLNKPMTEDQIELCAIEVIDTYGSLKMSDLTYLFRKIINGQFGEFYESLTVQKVLTFFRQYFNDRCDLAELESQRRHADFASIDTFNYSRNLRRIWNGWSCKSK